METHSSILAWRIPMDRGAWWATAHRVAKSWLRDKAHCSMGCETPRVNPDINHGLWVIMMCQWRFTDRDNVPGEKCSRMLISGEVVCVRGMVDRWEPSVLSSQFFCESKATLDIYCHPAYLTYMQSTSWETLGWRKHKLESRLPGEI